jgi:hypothetical protein
MQDKAFGKLYLICMVDGTHTTVATVINLVIKYATKLTPKLIGG